MNTRNLRWLRDLTATALLLTLGACGDADVEQRSDPCPAGEAGCPCAAAPACVDDLVCDTTEQVCRAPFDCDTLTCAPHILCAPAADGHDAYCDTACEPGFTFSERTGICSPLPPSCLLDEVTSILADCQAASRVCVHLGGRGRCGGCIPGFIRDPALPDGPCIEAPVCTPALIAECAGTGRDCADGACTGCLPDHVDDAGTCVPSNCGGAGVAGGIGDTCAAQFRLCAVGPQPGPAGDIAVARCTDCLPGHLLDETGEACRRVETCGSLACQSVRRLCVAGAADLDAECGACMAGHEDVGGRCAPISGAFCQGEGDLTPACAAEGRTCDPAGPLGAQCGECLPGRVVHPETGVCVEPMDCGTLGCDAQGRQCVDTPTAVCTTCLPDLVEDAAGFCREPLTCGDLACGRLECEEAPAGTVADARCVTPCRDDQLWNGRECAPCPPCDGPGVVGRDPRPTRAGWCICETAPGYFYSTANEVAAVPCDADGDGWVRENARQVFDSGDPVLVSNARCALREIDRIVLTDEAGEETTTFLDAPLPLYESVRNDDDRTLREQWARAGLPTDAWGPDGAGVSAALLNPFTKLCQSPRADHNDNGLVDAYEFGSAPLAPGFRPDQQPLNTYSYFLELHRGWFEALDGTPDQGAWHIAERRRDPATAGEVPLQYPGAETYWQSCQRRADPHVDQDPPVGMDFAAEGLLHHSQFKCVVVRDVPDEAQPLEMTPAQASARFEINDCLATGAPVAAAGGNPAEPRLGCTPAGGPPRPNTAVWGAVPYAAYQANPGHVGYTGGCVNTCAEAMYRHAQRADDLMCPGLAVNTPSCVGLEADYGRLECLEVPCDRVDNDADGQTDEDGPLSCATGLLGVCAEGTPRCDDTTLVCDPPTPTDEICDGLDNDCDGETDEDSSGVPCAAASPSTGLPAQAGLPGVCGVRATQCIAGVLDCLPVARYEPGVETTCDGLDNDCDGETDEELTGVPVPGQPDGTGFGDPCQDPAAQYQGACSVTAWKCEGGEITCLPVLDPAPEGCPAGSPAGCRRICDGVDNDCDGETDEDGACLRSWSGSFSLNPLLRAQDASFGGSNVTMNLTVEFGGQGTDEVLTTMTIEALEQYHTPTEGYIQRSVRTGAEGMVATFVGGNRFSMTYIDNDRTRDTLKAPGIDPANNRSEPNVQRVTDHAGVVTLVCNGTMEAGDDVVTVEGPYRNDRTGCELQFNVAYTIVPPENPCLGDPTPEVCDGLDNDCDGGVDEVDRGVPTQMVLVLGPQSQFTPSARLVAILADGREQVVLENTQLIWVDLGFFQIPLGQTVVVVPGGTLQLRFDDPNGGQIEVRDLRDQSGSRLPLPPDVVLLRAGQTSARVDFTDSLGLGQGCGNDVGACLPGTRACIDGAVACAGGIEPVAEPDVCDGIDDDCDGDIDEGIREACDSTCGRGTRACEGGGECMAECEVRCGVTGFRRCAAGANVYGACAWDFPAEVCDGIDNDCDGQVDDGFATNTACTVGVGVCAATGVIGCAADGTAGCSVQPGAPEAETCNGLDDDCDGAVDNVDPPLSDEQRGVCAGARLVCDGENGFIEPDYTARPDFEDPEVSCDGLDNDCDGQVDEPADLEAGPDADQQRGVCRGTLKVCRAGLWAEPNYAGVVGYQATEAACADRLDNDCDGTVDAADADCP
jgi:hypothetical protein